MIIKLKDLLEEAQRGPKKIDPNWRDRKWGSKRMGTNEGGPGSGKKKTGAAPKLQEPWNDPAEPVKNRSKLPRKSRSKEQDPTRRQVRSTKGKRAPKLKQFGEAVVGKEEYRTLREIEKVIHGFAAKVNHFRQTISLDKDAFRRNQEIVNSLRHVANEVGNHAKEMGSQARGR